MTPKLNLSVPTLINLIGWKPSVVQEPSFTCSKSTAELQSYLDIPYSPPLFSSHTQSTERCVKLVTEAAAAVCGQEARGGYIRVRLHSREEMPKFTSKKHILFSFPTNI